jgi:hypothetical protein
LPIAAYKIYAPALALAMVKLLFEQNQYVLTTLVHKPMENLASRTLLESVSALKIGDIEVENPMLGSITLALHCIERATFEVCIEDPKRRLPRVTRVLQTIETLSRDRGIWSVKDCTEVRLQNISSQYHLSDFPWPFTPDLHPTQTQIQQYLLAAVDKFQIKDGVQLYRHLIHPRIPNLAFVGFNHGFLHVPAVEIGTLWLCAHLVGELELPSVEQMEQDIAQIQQWKNAHIHFEPMRGCGVNVRYQQYIDILLRDLEVSPYRKMPNVFAEIFDTYNCSDYKNVLEEYNHNRKRRTTPLRPLAVST